MTAFRDAERALRAKERLQALAGQPLDAFFESGFALVADPDLALTNLERWLAALSNPGAYLDLLAGGQGVAKYLVVVLGASQPLANALIQNPELAALVFDPGELHKTPSVAQVELEGTTLLGSINSFSHALDRLRYLKQRWILPIVLNDLAGTWEEPEVWRALSDLAEGLIGLAVKVTWMESPLSKVIGSDCPFTVMAFGKLGGQELNYSSDVDLVYVSPDDFDPQHEREAQRFCEALTRSLSDAMGRGFLYRVDLRLRPYGMSGPLLPSMKAVETYYRLYAEPWEIQALLRSRPVFGPPDLTARWEAMRVEKCFGSRLSEASLDALASMRTRIEERASSSDLKRGPGGIRDVEFLVQILQLANGYDHPSVRPRPTLEALRGLEDANVLDHAVVSSLRDGYSFLRQLEHRCQLVGDQQTHEIPEALEARTRLAFLMGEFSWEPLQRQILLHRRTIETLYQTSVHPAVPSDSRRSQIERQLGPLAAAAFPWFDSLPDPDAFYEALVSNEGSLERVRTLLHAAPALVGAFRRSIGLTELLLSGEIEESFSPEERLAGLNIETPLHTVANVYTDLQARISAQWVLDPSFDLSLRLSCMLDGLIDHCMRRLYAEFTVIALGSYARQDMNLVSDGDLLLLVETGSEHRDAEEQAQALLSMFHMLKRHGAPVEIDLRLRPEGRQGLLVRTLEGFRSYELNRMEMWERFALGSSRLVKGSPACLEAVRRAAYAMPLTPERLKELIAIKKRIESERVSPPYLRRNVKLGWGGLGDLEWFVQLHKMRYPNATNASAHIRLDEGIRALGRASLINAVETEQLLAGLEHLTRVRTQLALLGYKDDRVPENPDKLDRLAQVSGDADANAFLLRHEHMIDTVRAIYLDGMERLRA